jgi:PadR family transcriptional regulator, regulatory protein PadR
LRHASEQKFSGQWITINWPATCLSSSTLYPTLHAMERRGYLKSKKEQNGRTIR